MAKRASTRGTVLIAGAANIFVGAIKLAAGLMVGSSAMLAEAAHSAADTLNQAFLLTSVHRGERPADQRHPFGYGQERYFWSLLAAFGIFVAGAGFSVFEGVLALLHSGSGNPLIAYVVLGVSGLAEGTSLVRVVVQLRGEARRGQVEVLDHMRAGRTGIGPAAGHRVTGVGWRGLHRHRCPARGGGGPARPGQPGLPHRPRRRPQGAGLLASATAIETSRGWTEVPSWPQAPDHRLRPAWCTIPPVIYRYAPT